MAAIEQRRPRIADAQRQLDEARQRAQRFAELALQAGISAAQRETFRNQELSARADVMVRQKALDRALRRRA
jgi:hypothetical protein